MISRMFFDENEGVQIELVPDTVYYTPYVGRALRTWGTVTGRTSARGPNFESVLRPQSRWVYNVDRRAWSRIDEEEKAVPW